MKVLDTSLQGTTDEFKQPVVLVNAANRLALAVVAKISNKHYIAYITAYADIWHKVKLYGGSDSLNMFNVRDTYTGQCVGCIV